MGIDYTAYVMYGLEINNNWLDYIINDVEYSYFRKQKICYQTASHWIKGAILGFKLLEVDLEDGFKGKQAAEFRKDINEELFWDEFNKLSLKLHEIYSSLTPNHKYEFSNLELLELVNKLEKLYDKKPELSIHIFIQQC